MSCGVEEICKNNECMTCSRYFNDLFVPIDDTVDLRKHCSVDDGFSYCVFDTGDVADCVMTNEISSKEQCQYWVNK